MISDIITQKIDLTVWIHLAQDYTIERKIWWECNYKIYAEIPLMQSTEFENQIEDLCK